jgi:hypothetical protein
MYNDGRETAADAVGEMFKLIDETMAQFKEKRQQWRTVREAKQAQLETDGRQLIPPPIRLKTEPEC